LDTNQFPFAGCFVWCGGWVECWLLLKGEDAKSFEQEVTRRGG